MNTIQALEFVAKRLNDQYEADLKGTSAHLDFHALSFMVTEIVEKMKEEK